MIHPVVPSTSVPSVGFLSWHNLTIAVVVLVVGGYIVFQLLMWMSGSTSVPTVTVVYGKPGDGKSMYVSHLVATRAKAGRRQYTSFHVLGAQPLVHLAHVWCEEFANSDFYIDEAASTFNSREYRNLDLLAFGALSHARHQGCTVTLLAQDPAMLESNIRRLAGAFVRVRRRGPSGEKGRGSKGVPPFWQRPIYFAARFYKPEQFDDGFKLREHARAYRTVRFRFTARLAKSYDSHNHVVPPALQAEVEALKAGAALCAALPPWQFGPDGKPLKLKLPVLPEFPVTQETVKAMKREKVEGDQAQEIRRNQLGELGLFGPEDAPPDAVDATWYVGEVAPGRGDKSMRIAVAGEVLAAVPLDGGGYEVAVREQGSNEVISLVLTDGLLSGRSAPGLVGRRIDVVVLVVKRGDKVFASVDAEKGLHVDAVA